MNYEISREAVVARFESMSGETAPADATTMDLFIWTREARDEARRDHVADHHARHRAVLCPICAAR